MMRTMSSDTPLARLLRVESFDEESASALATAIEEWLEEAKEKVVVQISFTNSLECFIVYTE